MCEQIKFIFKYLGTYIILLFLIIDGITAQSGLFKSEVFLDKDNVAGSIDGGPPEFGIKPGPEAAFLETPADYVPMSMKNKVLKGNYPHGDIDVQGYENKDERTKMNEMNKNQDSESGPSGRSLGFGIGIGGSGGGNGKKKYAKKILDPIRQLVPNVLTSAADVIGGIGNVIGGILGGTHAGIAIGVNTGAGLHVGGGAGAGGEANISLPEPGELAVKLLSCARNMVLCALADVFNVQCYLHCIFSSHPMGNAIMGSVNSLMNHMCNPIGTIFEEAVTLFAKHVRKIKTLSNFLTVLNVNVGSIKNFARQAALSIPTLLIKFLNLPATQDLKLTINALMAAIKSATRGMSATVLGDPTRNIGCKSINSIDPVQQLVGAVYKGAKFVDVVLQGFWTLKKIAAIVVVKSLKVITAVINVVISLLTGVNCNILNYALTGEIAELCPGIENEMEVIQNMTVVPPNHGTPVVCGSTPIVPRSAIDEVFPPIFELPEESVSEVAAGQKPKMEGRSLGPEGNATEIAGGLFNPASLDFAWVDKLLKTKNLDYDDDM